MSERDRFGELLDALADGITPVQPLAGPWRAALFLLPYCGLMSMVALAGFGVGRPAGLDPLFFWSATALELVCAYGILVLVRDESTPGEAHSAPSIVLAASAAFGLQLAISLAGWARVSSAPMPEAGSQAELFCGTARLFSGVGLVALTCWWTFRGLSLRPVTTGWLAAAGTALAVDAVWRLQCSNTSLWHCLAGHATPLYLLAALGVFLHWVLSAGWHRVSRDR